LTLSAVEERTNRKYLRHANDPSDIEDHTDISHSIIPMVHFPYSWANLPVQSDVFALHGGSDTGMGDIQGPMARPEAHRAMPSVGGDRV
jgi:hypothetical protein